MKENNRLINKTYERYFELISTGEEIILIWVKGHVGIIGN